MVVPAAVRACVGARGGVCVPAGKAPAYRVEGSMVCTASLGDAPPAVGAGGARVPVMALYGEHARELISSEVALRLAVMLCSAAAQRSASAFWGAAARSASARSLSFLSVQPCRRGRVLVEAAPSTQADEVSAKRRKTGSRVREAHSRRRPPRRAATHRSQLGKPTGRRGLMVDKDGSTDGDRCQLECCG